MATKLPNNLKISPILLTIILLHLQPSSSSSFTPADHYLINCGSPLSSIADSYNRNFIGDVSPSSSASVQLSPTRTIPLSESSSYGPLYDSVRVFTEPSSYSFKINRRGAHLVRLHFHKPMLEMLEGKVAKFHVLAGGYFLLKEFGSKNGFEMREFILPVHSDTLELLFVPVGNTSFGFISAIEVISAPNDLILDIASFVDSNGVTEFDGVSKNGYETVFRVNIGGPKITPFNDTLWRTWISDEEFLNSSGGLSREVRFSGRIKYQFGGATREVAPDHVYGSARVISGPETSESRFNLTWTFPVVGGYKYLVRTHFCDIVSPTLGSLYFNVYVNGNLAYGNFDLSTITNSLASPFYADFMVDEGDAGVVTVSVGNSALGVDAILNGVEVFKMSNSVKSFDGMLSAESVLRSCRGENVGFPVIFVIAIGVLLAVSLLLRKILVTVQDSVAWSRLPTDVSEVALKSSYQ
ncbi:hypothetical protein vseg_009359 [Gypsophila vaccaria]